MGENIDLEDKRTHYGLQQYFNGMVPNTDLTYTQRQSAEHKAIEGDSTTVIHAFVKRKTYRISYHLDRSEDTYDIIINGQTITAVDNIYFVEVKYGNLRNGPSKATEYFSPNKNETVNTMRVLILTEVPWILCIWAQKLVSRL